MEAECSEVTSHGRHPLTLSPDAFARGCLFTCFLNPSFHFFCNQSQLHTLPTSVYSIKTQPSILNQDLSDKGALGTSFNQGSPTLGPIIHANALVIITSNSQVPMEHFKDVGSPWLLLNGDLVQVGRQRGQSTPPAVGAVLGSGLALE